MMLQQELQPVPYSWTPVWPEDVPQALHSVLPMGEEQTWNLGSSQLLPHCTNLNKSWPALSQPSHDTEMRRGLELTSWDAAVPHFSLHLVCAVTVYLVRTLQKHHFPASHALSLHPTTEFQYISILGSVTHDRLKLQCSGTIFSQIKLI